MSNKGKAFLSLYLILSLVCGSVFEPKKLEITRIDGRCRGHKVPIKSDYRIIKSDGYVVWFNVTTTVTEDIPGTSSITAEVSRCSSKENLDSCQPYQEFKTNYCTMLSVSSLTPFSMKFTPPFKCPFKKGVYRAANNKIDFSTVLMMPMEKYYWKINLSLRDNKDNRLLFCIVCDAYSFTKGQK